MKVKIYTLLQRAIESGVRAGYERAHKHSDKPDKEVIFENIEREINQQLDEVFSFDDEAEV